MGILDQALAALKTAGFRAEEAFPGQQFPAIRAAVAAVHIQEVDGPSQTVTLGVSMVGPGSAGGVSCETQAGKAAKALEGLGAECIQGPCRYEGVSQVYVVEILARFRGTSGAESAAGSTGLRVRIGSGYLGYPQKFLAAQKKFPVYGMGEEIPAGALEGGWAITLEEQIPADGVEEEEPSEPFYIIVERNGKREVYTQCRWESVSREFTAGGIRKIRTGMAKIRTTMEV